MSQTPTTTHNSQTELEHKMEIAQQLEGVERAEMAEKLEAETTKAWEAAAVAKVASLEAEKKKEVVALQKKNRVTVESEEKKQVRFKHHMKGKGVKGGNWASQQTKVSTHMAYAVWNPC